MLVILLIIAIFITYLISIYYHYHFYYISFYGILTISNYIFQTIIAYLNRRECNKLLTLDENTSLLNSTKSLNIHVVGYKENEEYFTNCLKSCKNVEYNGLKYIIICIDGNDTDDLYMVDITKKYSLIVIISI